MRDFNRLNQQYRVKVTCEVYPKGRLLGKHGFIELVGLEMALKLYGRAEKSCADKCTCKLRRGLRFDFYVR